MRVNGIKTKWFHIHHQKDTIKDKLKISKGKIFLFIKRHGTGTMEYKNGDIYSGLWENDLRDGFGYMYY